MGLTRNFPLVLLAAFLLIPPAVSGSAAESPIYSLAVIPGGTPAATTAQWAPFIESLSRETGLAFQLRTYGTISEFEKAFEKGIPDFIFAHPIQTVAARRAQAYVPLVRASRKIAAVIFTRDDSPLQSARDLRGEKIALVGSRNVCSIMVRQELASGQKLRFGYRYVGTADNVINSVIDNQFAAGATLGSALEAAPREIRVRLRTIGSTPAFAPHPLSAHPRVPPAARDAVTAAVLKIGESAEGRKILEAVRLAEPVRADYETDYKPLEAVDNKIVSTEE